MGSCNDIREEFSDFYDNIMGVEERKAVAAHLATCQYCASEYRSFVRTLEVIRAIPAEEPVIDMWADFQPHFAAYEAEQKFSVADRIRRSWTRAIGGLSEGAILYTQRLAETTTKRLAKYLVHNPFSSK